MSTIDQTQITESLPAKDRRPNHWVTPPTLAWLARWKRRDKYERCWWPRKLRRIWFETFYRPI